MRCKICGITSLQDAIDAIEAGADALGFVFYDKSPRYIAPKDAQKIIEKLPPFVEKVALFVNLGVDEVNKMMKISKATLAQIHFEADDKFFDALTYPYIKVIRAKNQQDISKDKGHYRLVDAYTKAYGGEGKRLNIEWFDNIDCTKIILAGGLTPQNVASLKKYNFYGVDVSSGVEISYGKKDTNKIKEFIKNAKQ